MMYHIAVIFLTIVLVEVVYFVGRLFFKRRGPSIHDKAPPTYCRNPAQTNPATWDDCRWPFCKCDNGKHPWE